MTEDTSALTLTEAKLSEARRTIIMLRAALSPFADEAVMWVKLQYGADEPIVEAFPDYEGNLKVGSLYHAKIAYDEASEWLTKND